MLRFATSLRTTEIDDEKEARSPVRVVLNIFFNDVVKDEIDDELT